MPVNKRGIEYRDIKYRVFDVFTNIMWKWEDHSAFSTHKGSIKQWFEDQDLILMQYTGLNDINGIEVYEGDIVHHEFRDIAGVVVWGNYQWMIDSLDGEEYIGELAEYDFNLEVIGNKYENEELLIK